jgi:hypothetical protein
MANQKLRLTLALASALLAGHSSAQDATATSSGAASAEAATLPDGFEILERYVEAIGGEEAYRKHKNEEMTGSFKMEAMGIDGSIVILRAATTKTLVTVELGVMGSAVQGTNGEVAWASQPGQPMAIIKGAQADQMINESNYYATVEPRKTYTSAETVGIVTFDDVKCYKVNLLTSWDQHEVGLFEVESGLHRKVSTRDSVDTDVFTNEVTYSDYREVEGVQRPFKLEIKAAAMMGAVQNIEFDTIEFDVEIENGTFDPPGSF